MRIRVLNDLHREFGRVKLPEVAADVVVLTGDIDRGTTRALNALSPSKGFRPPR